MASRCNVDGCNCYSDVDVYFRDGTSTMMCSKHAGDAWLLVGEVIDQVVPQHGCDNVNVPIYED